LKLSLDMFVFVGCLHKEIDMMFAFYLQKSLIQNLIKV
jgi:hypothetical protein